MQIGTKFHGRMTLQDADVLVINRPPILGFADHVRYVLLPHSPTSPFLYLQSAENPQICFVVVDPLLWMPDYSIPDADVVDLGPRSTWAVLVLCTISAQGQRISANLRSPLVVNQEQRLGGQFVLSVPYPHQFPLMRQEDSHAGLNPKV